ncbi:MAG: 2-hydroxyglutaryl-CoA dehydratase, partial [Deltaproteobacteria bacterium CG07_land_8_20_14_0_80_38_7]
SGEPPYYITGGVAKNTGLVKELEKSLGEKIYVLNDPQFSGALGAAIIATKD